MEKSERRFAAHWNGSFIWLFRETRFAAFLFFACWVVWVLNQTPGGGWPRGARRASRLAAGVTVHDGPHGHPPAAGRLTGSPRKDPGVGTVGLGTGARVGQLHKMASLGWSRMSSQDPKSLNHGEERAKESKPGQFWGPQGELWFLADKPDWSPPISAQLPPAGAPPGGQNRPQPTSQPTPSSPGDIDVTCGLAL